MELDAAKLKRLIEDEVKEMAIFPYEDTSFCIGQINDMQIQVKITREEEDFFETSDVNDCITF